MLTYYFSTARPNVNKQGKVVLMVITITRELRPQKVLLNTHARNNTRTNSNLGSLFCAALLACLSLPFELEHATAHTYSLGLGTPLSEHNTELKIHLLLSPTVPYSPHQ